MKKRMLLLLLCCAVMAGCQGNGSPQGRQSRTITEEEAKKEKKKEEDTKRAETEEGEAGREEPKEEQTKESEQKKEETKAGSGQREQDAVIQASPTLSKDGLNGQMEVQAYVYTNAAGTVCCIVEVANHADATVSIETGVTAKDSQGNTLETDSASENAVAGGQAICLAHFFENTDADVFEYTIEAKEDEYFEPAFSDLSIEESDQGNQVAVTCTNEGEETAKFVQGMVLFFSGDRLLRHTTEFFMDGDNELKPGSTVTREFPFTGEEPYDHYKVYVSGRKS